MKRIVLWGSLIFVLVLALAVTMAFKFGEKSPVYAAGDIFISQDLAPAGTGIRTLYISLFDANAATMMPIGIVRERLRVDPTGSFFHFQITEEKLQRMNFTGGIPNEFRIKARLDYDGYAGVDSAGDLTGELPLVAYGSKGLKLVIDKKIN